MTEQDLIEDWTPLMGSKPSLSTASTLTLQLLLLSG